MKRSSKAIAARSSLCSAICAATPPSPRLPSPRKSSTSLREYHGALGPLVSQHEGTLDQFSGDGRPRPPRLLQCFARLGDKTSILHRDYCLCREVPQQCDLFFGERAHLLAEGRYGAEQTPIFAQRHYEKGACATKLGSGDAQPVA